MMLDQISGVSSTTQDNAISSVTPLLLNLEEAKRLVAARGGHDATRRVNVNPFDTTL